MAGLLVDDMTIPDILREPYDVDSLIQAMVPRVFGGPAAPDRPAEPSD